jgi:peptidoglycan/xylan/chitin deacetylase (PgdA/CDA1 family)
MYHFIRVNPVPSDRMGFNLSVTPDDFRQQMDWLASQGVHTVSIGDVMDALESGRPLPPRAVVLTFDDGFADFYSQAMPVMLAHGFTGTTYVVPGFLGQPNYMTSLEVQQAVWLGMVVGAHTMHHIDLTRASGDQAWAEISGSRQQLNQLTGQPVTDFAYPSGKFNGGVADLVQRAGFRSATTTMSGSFHNLGKRLALERVRVSGGETLAQFAASLSLDPLPPGTPAPAPTGEVSGLATPGSAAASGSAFLDAARLDLAVLPARRISLSMWAF